jgi:predicted NodU family carbamoyl transferase
MIQEEITLRDGYYLSVYFHISEIDYLLDIGKRHDQNMTLFCKKGHLIELIRVWELERHTGIKHFSRAFMDENHARTIINKLLEPLGLNLRDMVEVWGTPEIATVNDYTSCDDYPEYTYHSISHLFSAMFVDSEIFYGENIIGLAVDGGPDTVVDTTSVNKKFYAGAVNEKGSLTLSHVYSPGPLWETAANKLGMQEGTLMALAHASTTKAHMNIGEFPLIKDSQSLYEAKDFVERILNEINELTPDHAPMACTQFDSAFSLVENRISMVMKIIHEVSVRLMEINVERLLQESGLRPEETYLALSGGFALNCPTNSHLMKKYKFKGFLASPCVNDGGLSLGMGLFAFFKKMGRRMRFKFTHAYHGTDDRGSVIDTTFAPYVDRIEEFDTNIFVEDISESPVVWFNGNAELGPRALGNRSILGDPRKKETKELLNLYKKREWWRPVAPVILEEELEEWFEAEFMSPYMLHTFIVKEQVKHLMPAILHLDESARVQTIKNSSNVMLYRAIQGFKDATGVPMLCNTSLNDKGEPIIDSIEGALHFCLVNGISVAYINGSRVKLNNHARYNRDSSYDSKPYPRSQINVIDEHAATVAWSRINPNGIPKDVLITYRNLAFNQIVPYIDITDQDNVVRIKRLTKLGQKWAF